jgi:uncharacterized protein
VELNQIDQIARKAMLYRIDHPNREPGWLYHHGCRTGKVALWLADSLLEELDRDVLYTGALFHDVGKGNEPHNEIGAEKTRELLDSLCTAGEIDAICELIQKHTHRRNADEKVAVKLVQDADLLDHIGPIGPWLAFYWSGSRGETIEDHRRFLGGDENREYRAKMRAMLNFDLSRQEFDRRIRFEDEFFSTFNKVYEDGVWQQK